MGRPVVGGAEGDAVVVDVRRQGEHLVAAGVGEHVAVPSREPVEPAETGDDVGAWPEHQVVGVGEHELGPEVLEVGRRQRPHRSSRADGHEARGAKRAPRRRDGACAGIPVGRRHLHAEGHGARPTSMASPKERNR